MVRGVVTVCVTVLLTLVGSGACSSESDKGDDNNSGGDGATVGEGGGDPGSGLGGAASSAASAGDPCRAASIQCLDAQTAIACNTDAGVFQTLACSELAKDGLISSGCKKDQAGVGCTVDGYSDQACFDGAKPFHLCADLAENMFLDVYVNCFLDTRGLRDVVTCYADFVDAAAQTVDCAAAQAACLPATNN